MYQLVFKQQPNSPHGSCDCYLNDIRIDSCDMNYDDKYTQAHLVLGSVKHTLKTNDIKVSIVPAEGCPSVYPISDIEEFSTFMVDEEFNKKHPLIRIYGALRDMYMVSYN